ncbi:exporter of polyketide antibiotics [Leifsonia kafniensis]|uniref:Exporter of polyketide antibiotics n=1 Tax=Leifsonia kafniensis TaxID=475957 RepID=A0ABP7KZL3_9MICO
MNTSTAGMGAAGKGAAGTGTAGTDAASTALPNTGTLHTLGVLLAQRLRRDRIQLLIWILGIGLLGLFSATSVAQTYGDETGRIGIIRLAVANPVILMLRGLPQGTGLSAFVFFEIFTFLALLAGSMSTFLAVRHTRAEEETGRAELIASTPAARTLPTVATLIHGILANLVLGIVVALGMIGGRADVAGSLVTGAAVAAAGISFLGIGLLAAQFMLTSRGANAVAASIVGAAYIVRGLGDALGTPSPDGLRVTAAWPSWISPIGWGEHTGAYTTNDLTPLLLNLALAAVCVAVVFALQASRDSGASLIAGRAGRVTARPALSSSLGLAWRLQWPTLVGWCVGGAVCGLLAGILTKLIEQAASSDKTMQEILQKLVHGSQESSAQILISTMFSLAGIIAAACATQVVIRMRQEEALGTAELIIASPVSRVRWLVDYLVLGTVSIVLVLAVSAGVGALGIAASNNTGADAGDMFAAAAAQLPAALIYLGVLALVFVLLPGITIALGWTLVGIGVMFGVFGGLIGLPDWARDISPFTHTPVPSQGATDWSGGLWMLAIAILTALLALVLMRRRELQTA